jgi:hypothetical protein
MSKAPIVFAADASQDCPVVKLGAVEVDPLEGIGIDVTGAVAQYEEVLVAGRGLRRKTGLGVGGLLVGMRVALAVGWVRAVAFVARGRLGVIHSNDANADRLRGARATLELLDLLHEVSDDAIDLLDHGLGEDLDLNADFDSGNLAASDIEARVLNRRDAWDEFAKRAITPARLDAPPTILNIEHALARFNALGQESRLRDRAEVFIQVHRDEIAEAGIAVNVALALERGREGVEESVTQEAPSCGLRYGRDNRSQSAGRSNSSSVFRCLAAPRSMIDSRSPLHP